jgi:hypothetical protein
LTGRNTAKAWLVSSYQLLPLAGSMVARSSSMKMASARRSRSAYSGLDLAQDAHAQARAGEGVAVDHVVRQAQRHAEFAHLVLEQVAQRLQQLQAQRLGQAADVVVALDRGGLLGLGAAALDHVGVDRALRQPLGVRRSFFAPRPGRPRRTRGR